MIPKDLTNYELGTLLRAVGARMQAEDLLFDAVFDGNSHEKLHAEIACSLGYVMEGHDWREASYTRAEELLAMEPDEVL